MGDFLYSPSGGAYLSRTTVVVVVVIVVIIIVVIMDRTRPQSCVDCLMTCSLKLEREWPDASTLVSALVEQ